MAAATTSVNGYLTSTDWTTFNNKGSGTVTSVSGTAGQITSTGGTTPVIDLTSGIATAGTTGSASLIPVVTIDTYGRVTTITTAANPQGTVTSVAALTLGTTGTDLTSTVANGTTTPVITLNVPTASAANRGALSSTDWSTFNSKGSGSVTSVAASVPAFLSVAGSPITTSGTLAITLSGTALPVLNGGTGVTTSTGTGNAVLSGSPTLTGTVTPPGTGKLSDKLNIFGATTVPVNGTDVLAVSGTGVTRLQAWSIGGQYSVLNLGSGASGTATAGFLLTDATANTFVIQTSSNTPINVVSNSSGGVTLTSGATAWAAISDETLKTDLASIQSGVEKVASLRAMTGRYKTDEESVSRSFLIAQDVQKVLPEAVSTDVDGTLSLRYTEVIPLMVAAIQELTARLAALEAK
jgi:hypothetical protein